MNFKEWMYEVDRILLYRCGLDHMCLADCAYWDMFSDGYTPEEAAERVLEENDFPF